jgi:hypothetical protein
MIASRLIQALPLLTEAHRLSLAHRALSAAEHLARLGIGADAVNRPRPYLIDGGERRTVDTGGVTLATWEDALGLDQFATGFGERRGAPVRCIVLHWGGTDPEHCRRALVSRNLSTHIVIGRATPTCPPRAYQVLDLSRSAWHAGGLVNRWAIGIDIAQSPRIDLLSRTLARGYDVEPMANTTGRGSRECASLDLETAMVTRHVVMGIAKTYGVPLVCPRDDRGKASHKLLSDSVFANGVYRGVLGHHHVSGSKWDIAPWWRSVFGGTVLG